MISHLITYPVDLFTVHLSFLNTMTTIDTKSKAQHMLHLPNEKITKPTKKTPKPPNPSQNQPTNSTQKTTEKQKILSMDDWNWMFYNLTSAMNDLRHFPDFDLMQKML